jgi:hypothetical protein
MGNTRGLRRWRWQLCVPGTKWRCCCDGICSRDAGTQPVGRAQQRPRREYAQQQQRGAQDCVFQQPHAGRPPRTHTAPTPHLLRHAQLSDDAV